MKNITINNFAEHLGANENDISDEIQKMIRSIDFSILK